MKAHDLIDGIISIKIKKTIWLTAIKFMKKMFTNIHLTKNLLSFHRSNHIKVITKTSCFILMLLLCQVNSLSIQRMVAVGKFLSMFQQLQNADRQSEAVFLTSGFDVFLLYVETDPLYINPFWELIQCLHLVKSACSLSNSLAHLSYDTEQAL